MLPSSTATRTAGWRSAMVVEQRRHEPAPGGADDAEADVAGDLVPQRGDVGGEGVELGLDPAGPGHDHLALLGQAAGRAVDQGDAELAFEVGHVGGDVGLDGVQDLGRRREGAGVGHGHEGGQLAEVHRRLTIAGIERMCGGDGQVPGRLQSPPTGEWPPPGYSPYPLRRARPIPPDGQPFVALPCLDGRCGCLLRSRPHAAAGGQRADHRRRPEAGRDRARPHVPGESLVYRSTSSWGRRCRAWPWPGGPPPTPRGGPPTRCVAAATEAAKVLTGAGPALRPPVHGRPPGRRAARGAGDDVPVRHGQALRRRARPRRRRRHPLPGRRRGGLHGRPHRRVRLGPGQAGGGAARGATRTTSTSPRAGPTATASTTRRCSPPSGTRSPSTPTRACASSPRCGAGRRSTSTCRRACRRSPASSPADVLLPLPPARALPLRPLRPGRQRAHPRDGPGHRRRQPPQLLRHRRHRRSPSPAPGRPLRFLGKKEVFDAPVIGPVARAMGGIRVERGTGSDEPLAPGGPGPRGRRAGGPDAQGRSPGPGFFEPALQGRSGPARLAAMSGAPIVPVGLWGTEQVWPRNSRVPRLWDVASPPLVSVTVGAPVHGPGDDLDADTDPIMRPDHRPAPARGPRAPATPTDDEIAAALPPELTLDALSRRTRAVDAGIRAAASSSDRPSSMVRSMRDGLEQPAVVGDEEQGAVVAVEGGLELLDGGQVEVVGRLVEHEAVHARAMSRAEHGPGALAGRQRAAGRPTCSAPRPNLASSDRLSRAAGRRRRRRRRAAARRRGSGAGPGRARRPPRRARATRSPAASGSWPRRARAASSCPLPFGPRMATRSPQPISRSIGPEPERAPLDHRAVEPGHHVAAAGRRGDGAGRAPSPPTACRPPRAGRAPSR